MSKIIKDENSFSVKLNLYEKYIKMNHEERQTFLKFFIYSLSSLIFIIISLIIGFKKYILQFIISGIFILIILLIGYLFIYKKPKMGFSAFW